MYLNEELYEGSDEDLPLSLKEWLREFSHTLFSVLKGKGIMFAGIFLPWYLWMIAFYPIPILWWLAFGAGFLLTALTLLKPRTLFYWLAPTIVLFNTLYFWLPWPGVKISVVACASICLGLLFVNIKRDDADYISFDFKIFFVCLLAAALIAIFRFFDWKAGGAWHELFEQLRIIPILSEKEKYVSLRYVWIWLLAVSLFVMLRRIIKSIKDIRTIFWSLQFVSLIISAFGLYSYLTRRFMVSHYVFERRINATFSSPAVLADTFTAIFVIGIYLFQISKKKRTKAFLLCALIIQFGIIFLSGCRTNFALISIYLLILGSVYVIKFIKKTRWYVSVGAMAMLIILAVAGLHITNKVTKTGIKKLPVINRIIEWQKEYKHKKKLKKIILKGRFGHWITAGNIIKEYPMWGIGSGLFEQKYKKYHGAKDLFWYARTHCVPLRICAEGGFVSLIVFLIFITLALIRMSYGFSRRAREKEPEWAKLTGAMFIVFIMFFVSSFFTDIFYENTESIMILSLFAACGATAYNKLSRLFRQHFLTIQRKINYIEDELNYFFVGIGWEYLGFIKIKTIFKTIIILIVLILIIIGVSDSKKRRNNLFATGNLSYGFLNNYKKSWYVIGERATVSFIVNHPVFSFKYKSFNTKTILARQNLNVYLNGILTGKIPLNSVSEKTVYCDVSKYIGNKVTIDFMVSPVFIPLKEGWFIDNRKYGALITKPAQVRCDLRWARVKVKKDYSIKWLSDTEFHIKN